MCWESYQDPCFRSLELPAFFFLLPFSTENQFIVLFTLFRVSRSRISLTSAMRRLT